MCHGNGPQVVCCTVYSLGREPNALVRKNAWEQSPAQHVEHDGVDGIEEQVVVGEVVHAPSLPQHVAGIAAHLWRERPDRVGR